MEDGTSALDQCGVDWSYWARYPGWRTDEIAALVLGLDPYQTDTLDAKTAEKYERKRLWLLRAKNVGDLRSPIKPHAFLEWAVANGFEVPQNLKEAVAAVAPIRNWKKIAKERKKEVIQLRAELTERNAVSIETEDPRRLNTWCKLVMGMATKHYAYDPERRNSAAARISEHLTNTPYHLSEPAIRECLQRAADRAAT
jgi:hypothetical protein